MDAAEGGAGAADGGRGNLRTGRSGFARWTVPAVDPELPHDEVGGGNEVVEAAAGVENGREGVERDETLVLTETGEQAGLQNEIGGLPDTAPPGLSVATTGEESAGTGGGVVESFAMKR